jgi:hypothetical protein
MTNDEPGEDAAANDAATIPPQIVATITFLRLCTVNPE